MLIRNCEIRGHGHADLRIAGGRIGAIGMLAPGEGEEVLDAHGGHLLPGLHDHHIHLAGLAVQQSSVPCDPVSLRSFDDLAGLNIPNGSGWIRGFGFHESTTDGDLPDARELDRVLPDRPFRMQHSTGRMWFLNSAALAILLESSPPPPGLEHDGTRYTGRLFDEDAWLRDTLASTPPDLQDVSAALARHGVTGITDMTPGNDAVMAAHFGAQCDAGKLTQKLVLAGTIGLSGVSGKNWLPGPAKLHLHEAALPDFDDALTFVREAHVHNRGVAVHCVSEVELVFALALFADAGSRTGDRIEHVSVATPEHVSQMADLGLWACVQPHFIAERGDRYLEGVEPAHQPHLYRLQTLVDAAIPLSGGSDAPYGSSNPWKSMAAAVERKTAANVAIGPDESLSPETALSLWLTDPLDFTRDRDISVGEQADLCLLDRPWSSACEALDEVRVRATWISGRLVHDGIDKADL